MRLWMLVAAAALAGAAQVAGAGVAGADSGNSDAAQLCLPSLQWDYYDMVSGDPESVQFGGLVHGYDEAANSYYVQTANHDQCVEFFAKNKNDGSNKVQVSEITLTKTVDKASP